MNYSQMVSVLKGTIEEDCHEAATLLTLNAVNAIRASTKKPSDDLNEAAAALHSHILATAQHRWSVLSYFTGQGPIARKLKDYAAISSTFGMGHYKLEEKLKQFDFGAKLDEGGKGETFREWLEEVVINMFGSLHDLDLPLPYTEGIEIGMDTGIQIQGLQYTEDHQPEKWFVLAADLPNGVKVKFVTKHGATSILLYWHPHEEVWLADGAGVLIPGVWDALKTQWDSIADQAGYQSKPMDVEAETAELNRKAALIFDNPSKLPDVCEAYVKNGHESYIRFNAEHYHLIFGSSDGAYPSRYMMLSFNMGDAHSTTISFKDMREFARQELIKRAHSGLDSLIDRFIVEKEAEPPEPVEASATVEETQAPASPNYGQFNPVWRAINGDKGNK
ncbi:hypothetical protein [Burkholderia phage FLC9]|nr:hypothetical protein [Burkholderia phage FLC9]